TSYSVLPALALEGTIYCEARKGSYTSKRFRKSIRRLLLEMNLYSEPCSVIALDKTAIHEDRSIRRMVEGGEIYSVSPQKLWL
ncbi:hypothetical protein BS47DRAFT_1297689, partial [Hydnum rufescens UP504]